MTNFGNSMNPLFGRPQVSAARQREMVLEQIEQENEKTSAQMAQIARDTEERLQALPAPSQIEADRIAKALADIENLRDDLAEAKASAGKMRGTTGITPATETETESLNSSDVDKDKGKDKSTPSSAAESSTSSASSGSSTSSPSSASSGSSTSSPSSASSAPSASSASSSEASSGGASDAGSSESSSSGPR